MHEMSIAVELLGQIERLAAEHGAMRVERVALEVGVLRQVVPEAMVEAFAAVAEETVAAGATLELTEAPARARCNACGFEYNVGVDDYLCPHCRQAHAEILRGNDIVITSLVCRTDEKGEADEDQGR